MKGENELRLNEATMIMIVQAWIDDAMPHSKQTVTGVSLVSDSPLEFEIVVQGKDK